LTVANINKEYACLLQLNVMIYFSKVKTVWAIFST